jgi:hypothetical protein
LKAVEDKITSIARKCGIGKKGKDEVRTKSMVVKDAAQGTESIFESQAIEEDGEGSDDDDEEGHSDDEDEDDGAEQSALGALSFLGIDMDSQWSQ